MLSVMDPTTTEKKIEAYGVKGMQSKPWHKVFKNSDAMVRWAEKNDADITATRDAE